MRNVYFDFVVLLRKVVLLSKRAKRTFKEWIARRGYSEKVADELWKWYDFSDKRGVSSF